MSTRVIMASAVSTMTDRSQSCSDDDVIIKAIYRESKAKPKAREDPRTARMERDPPVESVEEADEEDEGDEEDELVDEAVLDGRLPVDEPSVP
jgi:hypothetical protein